MALSIYIYVHKSDQIPMDVEIDTQEEDRAEQNKLSQEQKLTFVTLSPRSTLVVISVFHGINQAA